MPPGNKPKIHTPSLIFVAIMMIATYFVTTMPMDKLDSLNIIRNYWWVDILIHGSYYFFLAILLFPLFNQKSNRTWWFFPILFILSVGFEFLQGSVPGRTISIRDIIGNLIGIGLAALFSYWGRRK